MLWGVIGFFLGTTILNYKPHLIKSRKYIIFSLILNQNKIFNFLFYLIFYIIFSNIVFSYLFFIWVHKNDWFIIFFSFLIEIFFQDNNMFFFKEKNNAYHKWTCFHQNNKKQCSIRKLDFWLKIYVFYFWVQIIIIFFNIFLWLLLFFIQWTILLIKKYFVVKHKKT